MMSNIQQEEKLTDTERERSISFILQEASIVPVTFRQFIRSFFKEFGLHFVFLGIGDVMFIVAVFLLGGSGYLFSSINLNLSNQGYFVAFITAPICYGLLYFLGVWKEIMVGTFELKMTLRLSLKELMIIRMLVFSTISLFLSVFSNYLLWQVLKEELSLLKLLSVSVASLFIFAISQIGLEKKISNRYSYWVTPILWLAVSTILIWQRVAVESVLLRVPLILVIGLIIGLIGLFLWLIRQNYYTKKEEVLTYVGT